jgi:membrane protease YdiL (CAAX protease family)
MLRNIFFTKDDLAGTRLRTLWRLALWILLTILISTVFAFGLRTLFATAGDPDGQGQLAGQIASSLASVAAITLGVFLARRWFDRRSFASLGLYLGGQAAKDLLAGFLIAAIMMLAIFFFFRLGGWMSVTRIGDAVPQQAAAGLLVMLALFVIVGWQEELFARGYLMQNLAEGLGSTGQRLAMPMAVILSSLVFGLGHLGNPNATLVGALGTGLAGAFLAFAYLRSRQLWLPIGIHIGLNFFEGPVLGFPVSGINGFYRLIEQSVSGPDWLTGGAFGPEASLIILPAMLLGTGLVWAYTRYRTGQTGL